MSRNRKPTSKEAKAKFMKRLEREFAWIEQKMLLKKEKTRSRTWKKPQRTNEEFRDEQQMQQFRDDFYDEYAEDEILYDMNQPLNTSSHWKRWDVDKDNYRNRKALWD